MSVKIALVFLIICCSSVYIKANTCTSNQKRLLAKYPTCKSITVQSLYGLFYRGRLERYLTPFFPNGCLNPHLPPILFGAFEQIVLTLIKKKAGYGRSTIKSDRFQSVFTNTMNKLNIRMVPSRGIGFGLPRSNSSKIKDISMQLMIHYAMFATNGLGYCSFFRNSTCITGDDAVKTACILAHASASAALYVMDLDYSNSLTVDEMFEIPKLVENQNKDYTFQKKMFKKYNLPRIDTNGNGVLDKSEYEAMVRKTLTLPPSRPRRRQGPYNKHGHGHK